MIDYQQVAELSGGATYKRSDERSQTIDVEDAVNSYVPIILAPSLISAIC